jgi:hypothetical protein
MMLERCPWYVAGPLIGLLIVALRATLNKPFGALGGYIELLERITDGAPAERRGVWLARILAFNRGERREHVPA